MSYHGYDPFHTIGSQDSTTLQTHTILLCAYNLSTPQFELYLSDIFGDGDTAFRSLKLYEGTYPGSGRLIATLLVEDSVHNNVGNVSLDSIIYPSVEVYTWALDVDPLTAVTEFTAVLEQFTVEETGTEFQGTIWFPYLDLGTMGREKMMESFDLISEAPLGLTVSFGYNQTNRALRTTPYTMTADTLPGTAVPMPISGPSFDMKIVFAARQQWEFEAACLYVQDWNKK